MVIQGMIARYGLAAIFVGAGVEGETSVIAGGVFAHKLFFPLWAAIAAAATGSFVADQIFFYAGRHFREHRLVRRMTGKPAYAKAMKKLERHPIAFILGFRFLYGLRTVSPMAVGTSHVKARAFLLLNAAAATIWAALFTGIGYGFGGPIERTFRRSGLIEHLPLALTIIVLMLIAVSQIVRWLHHRGEAADYDHAQQDAQQD
jgi:membrane protein DedA with SNARE-associated domain